MNVNLFRTIILLAAFSAHAVAAASPADDQYAIAAGHYASQQWELAFEEFDSFLQHYSQHAHAADALFYAAEALVQMRRFEAAGSMFEQFVTKNDAHVLTARARFRWGECAYFAGKHAEAIRLLRDFQRREPAHALNEFALPYLGNLLIETGDRRAARQAYESALEQFPNGKLADECMLQLAISAYREKQYVAAQEYLGRLELRFPQSKHQAEAAYWNGMILFHQRLYERAANSFQNAVTIDNQHRRVGASRYFAGESWRRHGDVAKARETFQSVLNQTADAEWVDDALAGLVRICLRSEDYDELDSHIAALEANFAHSPRLREARQLYGESLIKREEYARAIRLFQLLTKPNLDESALTERKARAINLYLLGVAYLGADRPRDAKLALERIQLDGLSAYFATQIRLAQAAAFNASGETDAVLTEMRQALASDPPADLADRCRYTLIRALLKSGHLDEAEIVFRDWKTRGSKPSDLRIRAARQVAEHAFKRQEYRLALRHFSQLLAVRSSEDDFAQCLSGLAWCHYQIGDHEDAVPTFDRLLEQYPESPEAFKARLARARSLQLLDRKDEALAAYLAIVGNQAQGQDWVIASLAAAEICESQGKADQAEALLKALVEHPATKDRSDQIWYQLGWTHLRRGRSEEAVEYFRRVYLDHPSSLYWSDATYRIAEQAFESGDSRLAKKMLARIAELPPEKQDANVLPYVLHLQGRIAASDRRWREALTPLKRLLAEYPASPLADSANFWMAEAHFKLAEYDAAQRHLQAIAEGGSSTESWRAMVLLRQAQISAVKKAWPEVNEAIGSLKADYPDFARAYEADFVLGRAHAARGEFHEARQLFDAIVEDPQGRLTVTAAMAQWMIGETYMHQQDYEQALRAYLKVDTVYDYPHWRAAALLQAGKCCERLGHSSYAGRFYRRIVDELPKTSYYAAAETRLRSVDATEFMPEFDEDEPEDRSPETTER